MREMDNAVSEIKSPCIKVCQLNEDDICIGCGRTRDDIRYWKLWPAEEKLRCLERCEKRKKGINCSPMM